MPHPLFPDADVLPHADPLAGMDDEVALGYEAALPFHLFADEPPHEAERLRTATGS
ncbi:MAG: hypothetical protein JNM26_06350 [Ideonella sp.]|nr:hypothetical protein [Ideonella sp.]